MPASDLARDPSVTDVRPQSAGRPAPGSGLALRTEVSRLDDLDDPVLVRMAGEIDCYTAPELKQRLFAVVDDQPVGRLDVDMAAVDLIDSNLRRGTAKVVEMTGLATAFHVGTAT